MTKKKAYIVYYGWFDGYLVHGVFTDLDEAKRIKEHLMILFPKDADKYGIEGLELNTFYSYHLKDTKTYNHGKRQ